MYKFLLSLFIACVTTISSAQELLEVKKYPIAENAIWTVDGLENIIISERDRIVKIHKSGNVLFEQSQKSLGRLDQIGVVNTLKIFGFSESQQLIGFFDNSLTSLEKNIDLSEYDLINVSAVAASSQSDKLWVFDQVNSTLLLLSLKGLLQSQYVKNIGGILNAADITEMVEFDNKLFILDRQNGIYVFDIYGTLIRFVKVDHIQSIQVFKNFIVGLKDDQLHLISLEDDKEPMVLPLNYKGVLSFHLDGNFIYWRTTNEIVKAQLIFK